MKTLKEFLAATPDAQKEVDVMISAAVEPAVAKATETATAEGIKTGEDNITARIKVASPFLSSTAYSQPIKDLAVKVLNGEVEASALSAAAASLDTTEEAAASAAAQAAQAAQLETAGDGSEQALSDDGIIRSEDDFAAAVALNRGEEA